MLAFAFDATLSSFAFDVTLSSFACDATLSSLLVLGLLELVGVMALAPEVVFKGAGALVGVTVLAPEVIFKGAGAELVGLPFRLLGRGLPGRVEATGGQSLAKADKSHRFTFFLTLRFLDSRLLLYVSKNEWLQRWLFWGWGT